MNSVAAADKPSVAARFRQALTVKRVVIGFLVAAIGLTSLLTTWSFALAICIIAVVGAVEFSNLAKRTGGEVSLPIAVAACAAYPALAYFHLLARYESALLTAIVLASFLAALPSGLHRFAGRTAMTVLAAMYLGKLTTYLVLLRLTPNGLILTFWLVIVVALTDIVGMIAGLGFGRRQLAPRLSPSKTIEGAVTALAVATVVGAAMWMLPQIRGPWWLAIAFPLSVSIAAEFGDLVESAFKRDAQVKDSGNIIAGHGGVLDRFDSYVFSGVVAYAVLSFAGKL